METNVPELPGRPQGKFSLLVPVLRTFSVGEGCPSQGKFASARLHRNQSWRIHCLLTQQLNRYKELVNNDYLGNRWPQDFPRKPFVSKRYLMLELLARLGSCFNDQNMERLSTEVSRVHQLLEKGPERICERRSAIFGERRLVDWKSQHRTPKGARNQARARCKRSSLVRYRESDVQRPARQHE